MKNLSNLIKGEMNRLVKYKILTTGVVVSFIWVLIIALSNKSEIQELIPLLMGIDAAMMSIMLLSASFYLEKQEGSIKSVLVAPINILEVLISKIVSIVIISLISALLVMGAALLFHKIEINVLLLIVYIIIIVTSHAAIGLVITLHSKDFGSMIGLYGAFALLSITPTILFSLEIIPASFENILLISPFHSGNMLLNSLFHNVDIITIIIAIAYLIGLGVLLYIGVVYKKFKRYAIEG